MTYQFLTSRRDGPIEYLTLNRPDVRNAFNAAMIDELATWAAGFAAGSGRPRAVVIAGAGPVFCAGADAEWMAGTVEYTRERNVADAAALSLMLSALDRLPVPLIGRVHGAALGGGAGLTAVCDVVVADSNAIFGFTEVKLGLIPAVISPFVLAKIGRSAARELFLTGRRFSADRARDIGLAHAVVPADQLDPTTASYVDDIAAAAPEAVSSAKALIRDVWGRGDRDAMRLTTEAIAARRVSPEGQEGLRAFLQKRKPAWNER